MDNPVTQLVVAGIMMLVLAAFFWGICWAIKEIARSIRALAAEWPWNLIAMFCGFHPNGHEQATAIKGADNPKKEKKQDDFAYVKYVLIGDYRIDGRLMHARSNEQIVAEVYQTQFGIDIIAVDFDIAQRIKFLLGRAGVDNVNVRTLDAVVQ